MDKNMKIASQLMDREICELARQLDDVQLRAAVVTATAMANGLGSVAALALSNIFLASEGYPPTPVYTLEDK